MKHNGPPHDAQTDASLAVAPDTKLNQDRKSSGPTLLMSCKAATRTLHTPTLAPPHNSVQHAADARQAFHADETGRLVRVP